MGKNPAWTWLVVWYFFLGGVAAGAYLLAALADLRGRAADGRFVRIGYGLPVPLVVLSAVLLTLDLGMPARTFHMFLALNFRSPMSVGAWALLGFGVLSLASFLLALRGRPEDRRIRLGVAVPGVILGFFIASYTGVLLSATNRPVWAGATWIGPLFLASALSMGGAALGLLLAQPVIARLRRIHFLGAGLEALLLIVLLASLGAGASLFLAGALAPLFWGGVVVAGLLAPAALALRAPGRIWDSVGAALVLVGGLALRYLVIAAGQA